MVVVSNGSWIVNVLIVLGMLVLLAGMARSFWRVARQPDRDRERPGDEADGTRP